ncbi:MAG: four helix bundle protein [Candidatus Doudnabacteria bacterium]|nr:four helix bundle protein [Candidatus Doudnabacteria bacterium]
MYVQNFKDIIAWQKSHKLTLVVYELTAKFPKHELFGLVSQMRRCSVSVPSNIAEGYKRKSKNDSIHFYVIAESSLEELRYQLFLSRDLKYITEKEYKQAEILAEEVAKLLYAWKINQK